MNEEDHLTEPYDIFVRSSDDLIRARSLRHEMLRHIIKASGHVQLIELNLDNDQRNSQVEASLASIDECIKNIDILTREYLMAHETLASKHEL